MGRGGKGKGRSTGGAGREKNVEVAGHLTEKWWRNVIEKMKRQGRMGDKEGEYGHASDHLLNRWSACDGCSTEKKGVGKREKYSLIGESLCSQSTGVCLSDRITISITHSLINSLTHSFPPSLTPSLSCSVTHSLPHSLTHTPPRARRKPGPFHW